MLLYRKLTMFKFAGNSILCVLVGVLLLSGYCAANNSQPKIELRYAADAKGDVEIVQMAGEPGADGIHVQGQLVAKWVPILPEFLSCDYFEQCVGKAVMREEGADRELLVLVGANDVEADHIEDIWRARDQYGNLALGLELTAQGDSRIRTLTQTALSNRETQRRVAVIISGKVVSVLLIVTPLYDQVMVPLPPSVTQSKTKLSNLLGASAAEMLLKEEAEVMIHVTWQHRVFVLVLLIALVLASFPAPNLGRPRHTKTWIMMGVVVGALIGAYMCGVSVRHGSLPTGPIEPAVRDDLVAIVQYTHINILGLLAGGIVGAAFGIPGGFISYLILRRAAHNASRLLNRVLGEQIDRVKECGLFVALRRFNKMQKAAMLMTVGVIVFLLLFPPWMGSQTKIISDEFPEGYAADGYEFLGFHWLFSGEELSLDTLCIITRVDLKLLVILIVGITLCCTIVVFSLRSEKAGSTKTF